ncbi:MAG: hypothetical protein WCI97_05950, partial [Bacteroidota bacterium]
MLKKISNKFILAGIASTLVFTACNNSSNEDKKVNMDSVLADSNRIDSLSADKKSSIEFKFSMTEA